MRLFLLKGRGQEETGHSNAMIMNLEVDCDRRCAFEQWGGQQMGLQASCTLWMAIATPRYISKPFVHGGHDAFATANIYKVPNFHGLIKLSTGQTMVCDWLASWN